MLYDDVIGIAGQLYCTLGVVGRPCKELIKGRIQRPYLTHISRRGIHIFGFDDARFHAYVRLFIELLFM